MPQTIYHYHPITSELTGSGLPDPSPLEPGVWLVPGFATYLEPITPVVNQAAVFDAAAQTWSAASDWRGNYFSTADGTPAQITALGVTPEQADVTALPRPDNTYAWVSATATTPGAWAIDPAIVAVQAAQARAEKCAAVQQQCIELNNEAGQIVTGMLASYVANTLTDAQKETFVAIGAYQMALLAVPKQPGFPDTVTWPTKPFS